MVCGIKCTQHIIEHYTGKTKQRLLLLPDGINGESEDREGTQSQATPEDVLVVSLGIINDCPGMLSESKVSCLGRFYCCADFIKNKYFPDKFKFIHRLLNRRTNKEKLSTIITFPVQMSPSQHRKFNSMKSGQGSLCHMTRIPLVSTNYPYFGKQ